MAIGTYTEIKDHLTSRLARGDIDDLMPVFIAEAERRIAAAVSLPAMEEDLTLTLDATRSAVAVPDGYLRLQGSIYISDDDTLTALNHYPVEMFHLLFKDTTSLGAPTSFYISSDDYFMFDHVADEAYSIVGTYYKMLTLSDTSPTNWLLTNYPMALVYGAMFEALVYTNDDPRTYAALFDEQIAKLKRYNSNRRNRYGARVFTQVAI